MSEFGRLLMYAAIIIAFILIGVPSLVYLETGKIGVALATFVFLVASCIWGWVVGGLDYRNEKE